MTLVDLEKPTRTIQLGGDLARKYEKLVTKLGPSLAVIELALNAMIDDVEIHTAGWMPGADWTGTPYQAIYEACGRDVEESGKSFGLIVWKVFEKRHETWASAHGMKDGQETRSHTYFVGLGAAGCSSAM